MIPARYGRALLNAPPACSISPACAPQAAKLISETFNVLSVTIWLFDEQDRLAFAASTSRSEHEANDAITKPTRLGAKI